MTSPKPRRLFFKEISASARRVIYTDDFQRLIIYEARDCGGLPTFAVMDGLCPELHLGHHLEADFISRTEAPDHFSMPLLDDFREWLSLRKRVPF